MNKLYTLPSGDGIELNRVFSVTHLIGFSRVKIEYMRNSALSISANGITTDCDTGELFVGFSSEQEAVLFRDDFIVLVNSAGLLGGKANQIEAARYGTGFGFLNYRYRVWNEDRSVVLVQTDHLKNAIDFLTGGIK